ALPHSGILRPGVVTRPGGERFPLLGEDLVESFPDLGHRPLEVELTARPPPPPLQPPAQIVEAPEPPGHAAAHEAAHRRLGAVAREDVVGDLVEDLADVEVGPERVLAAVPLFVPGLHGGPYVVPNFQAPGPAVCFVRRLERCSPSRANSRADAADCRLSSVRSRRCMMRPRPGARRNCARKVSAPMTSDVSAARPSSKSCCSAERFSAPRRRR